MSFELAQQCIDIGAREQELSPQEKLLLVVLCRFADDAGECYPSIPTLISLTGLEVRTVRKAVENLAKKGWLSFFQESGKRRQYRLNVSTIETCAADSPVQKRTPYKNAQGTKTNPVQICTLTPDKNAGGTPYKNAPRIKHIRNQEEINLLSVDDSSFSLEPDQPLAAGRTTAAKNDRIEVKAPSDVETEPAAKPARKQKHKAVTHEFSLAEMPDEWRKLCEEIRPDLDPERVFIEFKFYWTQGRGQGTKRSDKGWTTTWMNWIKRQKEQRVQRPTYYPTSKAPVPEIPFEERDYGEGINDDHSF